MMVLIRKGDKVLLAMHTPSPTKRFTPLAGFLEAGESVEEAVHREVFEEVGLRVHNLKYFASQSWPFPHSLMIAFTADYLDGEIRVDAERNLRGALVRARRRVAGADRRMCRCRACWSTRTGRRGNTGSATWPSTGVCSGLAPVPRSCMVRFIRSNQNGAPNSAVDAVISQPATCSAKAPSSTGGKLLPADRQREQRFERARVERAGRGAECGRHRRMLPQRAEQVDAVDVEQHRQQQRQQQADQQRAPLVGARHALHRAVEPAGHALLERLHVAAGALVDALQRAPHLRVGQRIDVAPELGVVAGHGLDRVDQRDREMQRLDVGGLGLQRALVGAGAVVVRVDQRMRCTARAPGR